MKFEKKKNVLYTTFEKPKSTFFLLPTKKESIF